MFSDMFKILLKELGIGSEMQLGTLREKKTDDN